MIDQASFGAKKKKQRRMMIIILVCLTLTQCGGIIFFHHTMSSLGDKLVMVEGVIVESKVDRPYDKEADPEAVEFGHTIRYSYTVKGKQYQDTSLYLGEPIKMTLAEAEKIVAKYPKGAKVDVYYDDGRPYSAELEPQKTDPTSSLLNNIPIFMGVSLVILLVAVPVSWKLHWSKMSTQMAQAIQDAKDQEEDNATADAAE
ncbi:MAG: DUF3592 domain-containing protein [bacterium]|nr:DUF3592 domain-containing protein [bacterium]